MATMYIKPKWRKYIPHFEIYLSFPLIRTQMIIFNEDQMFMRFVYLGFQWQIWKWEGRVLLFEIGREFIARLEASDLNDDEMIILDKKGCFYHKKYKARFYCANHWGDEHMKNLKIRLKEKSEK